MPAISASTPAPVIAEPKNTGCTQRRARLRGELAAAAGRTARPSRRRRTRASNASSCSASTLGERGRRTPRRRRRTARTRRRACRARVTAAHRDDRRRELLGDRRAARARRSAPARSILFTNRSVGMPQPLQRAHQHPGLRLHALDGRDRPAPRRRARSSTRSTSAMKSGWPGVSIRLTVTSPIDERHDGRLDRDAALAFQREGVGLGAAVVDAADLVDDAGCVEQPLGQVVLPASTCARIPKVQRSHDASCPSDRCLPSGWT